MKAIIYSITEKSQITSTGINLLVGKKLDVTINIKFKSVPDKKLEQ